MYKLHNHYKYKIIQNLAMQYKYNTALKNSQRQLLHS